MKIPNWDRPSTGVQVSLARIVSEDSQLEDAAKGSSHKSSKDS